MTNVRIIDLARRLDLRDFALPAGAVLYAALAGATRSGSIKDIGLSHVLACAAACGTFAPGMSLAEFSNGSMARSLAQAAAERGVDAFVSFPGVSQAAVDAICGPFRATALPVQPAPAEHPLVGYFTAFRALCRQRGLFYPDQTQNPLFREGYALFASRLCALISAEHGPTRIASVVASVGTGSTLMGCADGLRRQNRALHVVAVEPAHKADSWPPWEHIPGLRNTEAFHWSHFGQRDCYAPGDVKQRIEVTAREARGFLERLQAAGIQAGLSAGATLAGALTAARTAPGPTLLIFPDGRLDG